MLALTQPNFFSSIWWHQKRQAKEHRSYHTWNYKCHYRKVYSTFYNKVEINFFFGLVNVSIPELNRMSYTIYVWPLYKLHFDRDSNYQFALESRVNHRLKQFRFCSDRILNSFFLSSDFDLNSPNFRLESELCLNYFFPFEIWKFRQSSDPILNSVWIIIRTAYLSKIWY